MNSDKKLQRKLYMWYNESYWSRDVAPKIRSPCMYGAFVRTLARTYVLLSVRHAKYS
jgi:hypothetical protein